MSGISVATIRDPEFVNITSISPFVSKCEIKVLYVGQNRNHSFISKEVATEMAQTLPGCPIVGYYNEDKEDYRDHGEQVVINGDGIKFDSLTKPYGFIAPDSRVWFKEFEDTDDFGNKVLREYLMTEGYLWTGQFEEVNKVIEEGRPQSMELDENSMQGHWSIDNNSGIEFFIINDAIFSKLCILGEDVEPCFEGSSVTAPDVSANFTITNNDFTKTLYSMMQELKELTYSLQDKGGTSMADLENINEAAQVEETSVESTDTEKTPIDTNEGENENFSASEDNSNSDNLAENDSNIEEYKKNDNDSDSDNDNDNNDDSNTDDNAENKEDEDEKDSKKKYDLEDKYNLLEQELNQLKIEYTALKEENTELIKFKQNVENQQKDELINSFYMLSDEDKKDVIENKSKYSLDEIESKLSVICVRKKVDFNLKDEEATEKDLKNVVTYNLNDTSDILPAWLKAVEDRRNENN